MKDRFQQSFSERARQSEAAKLANFEAFRAGLTPNSQSNAESDIQAPEMPSAVATASTDSKVSSDPKPLLRWVPKRFRTPLLAATAGFAALGAVACTSGSGNNAEVPQAPTNQGEVLGGAYVTPVPSVLAGNTLEATNTAVHGGNFVAEGQKISDFELKGPDGTFRLSDAMGKSMLLIYCCNQSDLEVKTINDLKALYGKQLVILPIVINGSLNGSVNPFYVEDPYDVNSTNHILMVRGTPFVVAISRDRTVIDERGGDDYLVNIDSLAQKLIARSEVTPSDTLTIDESKVGIPLVPYEASWDLAYIAEIAALLYQSGQTTPEEAQYISSTIAQADQMIKTYGEQQKGASSLAAIAPAGRKLADIYCRYLDRKGLYLGVYNTSRELATYATRTFERYAKLGLVDARDWDKYAANFAPNCQMQYPTDN